MAAVVAQKGSSLSKDKALAQKDGLRGFRDAKRGVRGLGAGEGELLNVLMGSSLGGRLDVSQSARGLGWQAGAGWGGK